MRCSKKNPEEDDMDIYGHIYIYIYIYGHDELFDISNIKPSLFRSMAVIAGENTSHGNLVDSGVRRMMCFEKIESCTVDGHLRW